MVDNDQLPVGHNDDQPWLAAGNCCTPAASPLLAELSEPGAGAQSRHGGVPSEP